MQNSLWFIDGVDLWTTFSMILEDGSADFLRYAPKKPSLEHDWADANGIDVDLSRIFLAKREGVLRLAILVNSEEEFWAKHDGFIVMMTQPGLRRFELTSHGNRSYYIYYQETSNYDPVKSLKGSSTAYKIAYRFSIVVVEPEPRINASNIFIITDDGRFLIT